MQLLRRLMDILDPFSCTKLHIVHVDSMHVGKSYHFWSKAKAISFYHSVKGSYPITTIKNEITGEKWEHDQWDEFYKDYVFPRNISFDNEMMKLPGGAY